MKQFASWSSSSESFIFATDEDTNPGLYFSDITLSDGQTEVTFQLTVFILMAEQDPETELILVPGIIEESGEESGDDNNVEGN